MDSSDLERAYGTLSALQLAAMMHSGGVDPVAVTTAALSRIETYDDPAVFTAVTAERALHEAEAASRRLGAGRPTGLLDGVPVAWKDLFDLAGEVTTAGSALLKDAPPAAADAPVVARLAAAGMVSLGRVNMTEFAYSGLGLNPHYGTPRNPVAADTVRIPGGSSSGSGVAVRAGLAPVSIGTDTGGSVRIPAAFNGLVGYKASHGRYPMDGVFPLSTSLDSLGVLARSVLDAAFVDAAMSGKLAPSVTRRSAQGLRLIVPTNVVFDDAEPGVVEGFEAALSRLSALGVAVERRAVPQIDAFFDLTAEKGALIAAEAHALHADWLAGPKAGLYDPRVAARLDLGRTMSAVDLIAIRDTRRRLVADMAGELGADVMIAYPTVAHVAPPLEPLLADDALYVETNVRTLRNTMIGNFLDFCGVTLPCGVADGDMPCGFLLSAANGFDSALLSAALAIEETVRA